VEPLLKSTGFENVGVRLKEESRDFIKNWLPNSGCEKFVVSAEITGTKPLGPVVMRVVAADESASVETTEAP